MPTTKATTTTTIPVATTAPVAPVSGPQTVLSPIGLHVRAGPSKSAPVLGTAAQGTVLHLLGRTKAHGGWLKVRGATVTGWMSADPSLSAPGRFNAYSSGSFDVLYPTGWSATGAPGKGVVFKASAGASRVVMRAASTLAKLHISVPGGVVSSSRQVVACGFTSFLYGYASSTPGRYVYTVAFHLAPAHFVGLKAALGPPDGPSTVMDFLNSASFPFPQCVGGLPAHPAHASHRPHTPGRHPAPTSTVSRRAPTTTAARNGGPSSTAH